ncbi:MAG: aminotransferase class III-fold pyridoxal phosphate-dependent enzyme, partial [Deltaproteobacteria bacterium]|nr:aminotransferase class III-fold pyridoxal phosphate-dependent enzyme [Deltaproteobacteria bacterium]
QLPERAATMGDALMQRLREFATAKPELVDTVRGRGLLVGLVLKDAERAASIPRRALDTGVLINVTAGRVVRFFPALNIPEEELWPAVEKVLALVAD